MENSERIIEDIIEYEHTDSELAKYTIVSLHNRINNLEKELKKCEEDISFCLHSIVQEKNTSTDKRTRQEMLSCEQILSERLKKLRRNKNVK